MAVDMSQPVAGEMQLAGIAARYADPDPALVGKLPRITCRDCSNKRCQQHSKERCQTCGSWITTAHIHLDYVGHAEITMILLEIDPLWTWEPAAWGADGGPMIRRNTDDPDNPMLELWGTLTVLGHSRPAVGTCPPKPDAAKELVGDLLRNGAMRFGIATGLWARTDAEARRHAIDAEPSPQSNGGQPVPQQQRQAPPRDDDEPPPGDPDDAPPPPARQPPQQGGGKRMASDKQVGLLMGAVREFATSSAHPGMVDGAALSVAVFGRAPKAADQVQITSTQCSALIDMVKGAEAYGQRPAKDPDPDRVEALCLLAAAAQTAGVEDREVPAWIRQRAELPEDAGLGSCDVIPLADAAEQVANDPKLVEPF